MNEVERLVRILTVDNATAVEEDAALARLADLARLGLAMDGVTAEDCECAARVVGDQKRFDGYSDRESRKKQARFVDALGRLAAVLRDRERSALERGGAG